MRKRSKYRPKPIFRNPVAYVLESMTPMAQHGDELMTLKIKNHQALTALTRGEATRADIDILIGALNIAEALYRLGFGREYQDVVAQGHAALRSVGSRGALSNKFILTGPEMTALNLIMELHDAQLDLCVVQDIEKALAIVDKERRSGRMFRIQGLSHANSTRTTGDTQESTPTHHPPKANRDSCQEWND